MGALKTAASLLARFSLCFALIACVWITSIGYRIGAFDFRSHMLGLRDMIGPTYMKDVFLCLLACEALRQARRLWLTHRADLLLHA